MHFFKYIDNIKKVIEESNIESLTYKIINNVHAKNLILLEFPKDKEVEVQKIKNDLNEHYSKSIEQIYLKPLEESSNNLMINKILEVCKDEHIVYGNTSYNSWKSNINKEASNSKVISAYSFKGGVGRSQTLAYIAFVLYKLGKKVIVLDCDFEAPGISDLLSEKSEVESKGGILDYLLDSNLDSELDLNSYSFDVHEKSSDGKLKIFPSGIKYHEELYITKLSKIIFDSNSFSEKIKKLINDIDVKLNPDYILVDLRAGVSEMNGNILRELSSKRMLFFGSDEQSKTGLKIIQDNLPKENTFLINSLIRYQGSDHRVDPHERFKQYLSDSEINYNTPIKLPYINSFLDANFEGIKEEALKNIGSMGSMDDKVFNSVQLIDLFKNIFPEILELRTKLAIDNIKTVKKVTPKEIKRLKKLTLEKEKQIKEFKILDDFLINNLDKIDLMSDNFLKIEKKFERALEEIEKIDFNDESPNLDIMKDINYTIEKFSNLTDILSKLGDKK